MSLKECLGWRGPAGSYVLERGKFSKAHRGEVRALVTHIGDSAHSRAEDYDLQGSRYPGPGLWPGDRPGAVERPVPAEDEALSGPQSAALEEAKGEPPQNGVRLRAAPNGYMSKN